MVIPCIDLLGGKVVQLVQGERKALELASADEALRMFEGFPLIHVIDLDAAKGQGDNSTMVETIAGQVRARVGGGVRSLEKAVELLDLGAEQVIVGTRAFNSAGVDEAFLSALSAKIGVDRTIIAIDVKNGKVAIKGWQEVVHFTPAEVIQTLKPYCAGFLCTYVDKEGMMEGTDVDLFLDLKSRTKRDLIAAGGITTMEEVCALTDAGIQVALGMAIYTGALNLDELRALDWAG